jgi:phosphatidylglycerophosphatase A
MKTSFLSWIQRAVASMLFLGYIPFISGTIGSAATTAAVWWACCHRHLRPVTPLGLWAMALGVTAVSILAASRPREVFGSDDPHEVVIDECAGQLVTFLFIPLSLKTLILGFFLFRFFDIVKPYPVHKFESLEGGLGITMDDFAAGIYANITLIAVLWAYHTVKALL